MRYDPRPRGQEARAIWSARGSPIAAGLRGRKGGRATLILDSLLIRDCRNNRYAALIDHTERWEIANCFTVLAMSTRHERPMRYFLLTIIVLIAVTAFTQRQPRRLVLRPTKPLPAVQIP